MSGRQNLSFEKFSRLGNLASQNVLTQSVNLERSSSRKLSTNRIQRNVKNSNNLASILVTPHDSNHTKAARTFLSNRSSRSVYERVNRDNILKLSEGAENKKADIKVKFMSMKKLYDFDVPLPSSDASLEEWESLLNSAIRYITIKQNAGRQKAVLTFFVILIEYGFKYFGIDHLDGLCNNFMKGFHRYENSIIKKCENFFDNHSEEIVRQPPEVDIAIKILIDTTIVAITNNIPDMFKGFINKEFVDKIKDYILNSVFASNDVQERISKIDRNTNLDTIVNEIGNSPFDKVMGVAQNAAQQFTSGNGNAMSNLVNIGLSLFGGQDDEDENEEEEKDIYVPRN